ncbi:MAG: phosphotransferase [Bacteroidales bacterium]
MPADLNLKYILNKFKIEGNFIQAKELTSGHINDSFLVEVENKNKQINYVLQKINSTVFSKPEFISHNIATISPTLQHFYKDYPDHYFIRIYPTKDNQYIFFDSEKTPWRLINYIPNSYSPLIPDSPELIIEGSKEYALFQKALINVDQKKIKCPIPNFHNLNFRFQEFNSALEKNNNTRIKRAKKQISFAQSKKHYATEMEKLLNLIPTRITHNDTKISNVLFDIDSKKAKAVIDLDTLMPGNLLWDFGDMARTFCSLSAEDEVHLESVHFHLDLFESLCKGYISELKDIMTKEEKDNIYFGVKYITFIMGLRFLTDYLNNDIYYKIQYFDHNLIRSKNQFRLVSEIEKHEKEIKTIIEQAIDN